MRRTAQAMLFGVLLAPISCEPLPTMTLPEGVGVQGALLYEPILSGSAYRIDAVTGTSLTLVNNQGTVTAPWDGDTRFRSANLNLFPNDPIIPTDPLHPCYDEVVAYNNAGLGDSFVPLLSTLAQCGSNARVVIQFDNGLPPSPIRILSFQPIP